MLIDEYLEYLNGTAGKSQGTIKQYRSCLNLFTCYMSKKTEHTKETKFSITREIVKKIKLSDIDGFLSSMNLNVDKDGKKTGNGNGAKKNKISTLKSFFKYCKREKLIKENIMLELEDIPKKDKRVAKCFTLEESKRLVNEVGGRNKERDKMIIILFLNTGLRLEELVNLNIFCVKNQDLNIIGKGNKERVVHLDLSVVNLLKKYIENVRPESKKELNALFLSERLTRISCRTVQSAVNNAISNAGLNVEGKNDMSVHALRHTFATLQFQNNVSIRTLQKILGHEDISTTQIYVQVADNQMIEAAKTNPLLSIF